MKRLVLMLLFVFPIIANSQIINIPADYLTIQEGIDAANEGDTILVQPGIYLENLVMQNKNITLASLFLTTGDTNHISNTVIDGDTNSRVLFMENISEQGLLCGLTLRNGKVEGEFGGGILMAESHPVIRDMVVSNNTAERGGGICCQFSSLNLHNVTLSQNSSENRGGGIMVINSEVFMVDCILNDNHSQMGSGMYCNFNIEEPLNYTVDIHSCLVSENVSSMATPGIFIDRAGGNNEVEVLITECDFLNNFGDGNGALQIRGENIIFDVLNSRFIGNTVTKFTAGAAFVIGCEGRMVNCLFDSNIACLGGGDFNTGGITFWGPVEVYLFNCTFVNNEASYGAGLTIGPNAVTHVTNCIFWGNDYQQIAVVDYDNTGGTLIIDYSDLEEGMDSIRVDPFSTLNWGDHNISGDPLFLDSGPDAYSLTAGSPCIDNGTPDTTGMELPPIDLIGNIRVWDGGGGTAIIDMGPYEYGAPVWVGIDEDPVILTDEGMSLSLYPNPCRDNLDIRIELEESQRITVEIYNVTGNKVMQCIDKTMTSGTQSVRISLEDFPTGIYFVRIASSKHAVSRKLIVQ